jgi:monoamine oxidase
MMTDVLIIGAGLAGLSAALACREAGLDFRILEAGAAAGGRAQTRRIGAHPADMGGHWLHGETSPLRAVIDRYGLDARADEGEFYISENGSLRRSDEDWLERALDQDLARRIREGQAPDAPLPDLARDERGRVWLEDFGYLWNGLEPPLRPSAREFLTDENTPGGLQLRGGIGALIEALASDVGHARIRSHTVVTHLISISDSVCARASDGSTWLARRAIVTVSLGVLTSGMIRFDPPLSESARAQFDGMRMGDMNKIVIAVDPGFFRDRGVAPDTAYELLDARPPHFCHVQSGGLPLIQLYACGQRARQIERLSAEQATGYVSALLRHVPALAGFEAHMQDAPLISTWSSNLFTQGAYTALLPGHKRSGPRVEGPIVLCGEAFDERFPASLAGAWRSGQAAVRRLGETGLHVQHLTAV